MVNRSGFVVGLSLTCMVMAVGVADAATITAVAASSEIEVSGTTSISIFLDLEPGEEASVFEGRFELGGLGIVADAVLDSAGGPTWPSSFGNISGSVAIVSLTSNNLTGSRLVATIGITGLAVGNFDLILGDPTFASFDIPGPPFLEDLVITNAPGELLARVRVVPLPPAVMLLGFALGSLGLLRGKRTTPDS